MKNMYFILGCVLLSGCTATMIQGTEQKLTVTTFPSNAKVEFSNGQNCISPCSITCKRNQSLLVTISKEGCKTQTITVSRVISGTGGAVGTWFDYGTGGVYELQPNPLTVTLACEENINKSR